MLGPVSRRKSQPGQGCRRVASRCGFSLIELMVVVALIAIVVVLAAPSFRDYVLAQRVRSIHAQLVTDLQFARSEAAARGRFVGVQFEYRSGSGENDGSCYIVFVRRQSPEANPRSCNCYGETVASRCTSGDTEEVRRVLIPNRLEVTVRVPPDIEAAAGGTWRPVAYFSPIDGSYVAGNSAPAGLDNAFEITTKADDAKALRTIVTPVGRPALCTPVGSQLGGSAC